MIRPVGSGRRKKPWRVRIRDADGEVLGAGMVLGTGYVLTCAHVVAGPDGRPRKITVDLVGLQGGRSATARVAAGGWVPADADGRGDVALLELDRALPEGCGAPLRRVPLNWERPARTYGFPEGHPFGHWVGALVGDDSGPDGEWVQMNARDPADQVREGFSGAAVIDGETDDDAQTDHVIGMTVARNRDVLARVWYMLPVETIGRYLPSIAQWVSGEGASDPRSTQNFDPWIEDVGFAREVATWCASRETGRVWVTVAGDPDSARSAVLRRAVLLADREKRPQDTDQVVADAPAGTVPPAGSVDLAIDAAGRTAEQASQRILDRLSVQRDESSSPSDRVRVVPSPMTLVVYGIDDADDPAALVDEVLRPLAEQGCRLLLAFRSAGSPSLGVARSLESLGLESRSLGERLERLDGRVAEVGAAEDAVRRRYGDLVTRFASEPDVEVSDHAVSLRFGVTALRRADVERERDWIVTTLGRYERAAERAMRRAQTKLRWLDELLAKHDAEHDELRWRLKSYWAMAADNGLAEDAELGQRYRGALERCGQSPCDLRLTRETVERYVRTVLRKIGRGEVAP